MKNKSFDLETNPSDDLPGKFSSVNFKKKHKKRKLPDAFYPSWELEILSSFVAIFLLWILPDWIMDTNTLLSSKHGIQINAPWMDILGSFIMVGFITSFIFRIIWLSMVWKWQSHGSSRGDEIFKSREAKKIKLQSAKHQRVAIIIDQVAEALFFIASIVLFLTLLGYLIHVLGSLLHHSLPQTNAIPTSIG